MNLDTPMLLRPAMVQPMLGISRSTLLRWVKSGVLPQPVKIGPRAVAFRADDIEAWIGSRRPKPL